VEAGRVEAAATVVVAPAVVVRAEAARVAEAKAAPAAEVAREALEAQEEEDEVAAQGTPARPWLISRDLSCRRFQICRAIISRFCGCSPKARADFRF
jgi:hypothetical protein